MKKILFCSLAVTCFTLLSCSGIEDRLFPKSLDGKGEVKLMGTFSDAGARALFDGEPAINAALNEFSPGGISAAEYNYGGIRIYLGMARCSSTDDAFGIYSALTAMPRDRWTFGRGEMSYRSPYVSGYNGEYVFWFYSPSNPMTYTGYYKQHGEKMLAEFENLRRAPDSSYHWKILPLENRYADSIFYVRSRFINGVEVTNAYAATFQMQSNVSKIYVMKLASERDAADRFKNQKKHLEAENKILTSFVPMPGAPNEAIHWQEKGGTWVLCRYRWMMFLFQDMSGMEATNNFIRILFKYMAKTRAEALQKPVE
jgi:hypothetical protein